MADFELILMLLLVVDALALIALVLIQQGKGADVGAAFGSGSSNTMFGSSGAGSFLTTMTTWLTVGFFVISFGLAYFAKERAAGLTDLGIPTIEDSLSIDGDIDAGLDTNPDASLGDAELEGAAARVSEAVDAEDLPQELQNAIREAGEDSSGAGTDGQDTGIPDL